VLLENSPRGRLVHSLTIVDTQMAGLQFTMSFGFHANFRREREANLTIYTAIILWKA
jgi:hypothetical protein